MYIWHRLYYDAHILASGFVLYTIFMHGTVRLEEQIAGQDTRQISIFEHLRSKTSTYICRMFRSLDNLWLLIHVHCTENTTNGRMWDTATCLCSTSYESAYLCMFLFLFFIWMYTAMCVVYIIVLPSFALVISLFIISCSLMSSWKEDDNRIWYTGTSLYMNFLPYVYVCMYVRTYVCMQLPHSAPESCCHSSVKFNIKSKRKDDHNRTKAHCFCSNLYISVCVCVCLSACTQLPHSATY